MGGTAWLSNCDTLGRAGCPELPQVPLSHAAACSASHGCTIQRDADLAVPQHFSHALQVDTTSEQEHARCGSQQVDNNPRSSAWPTYGRSHPAGLLSAPL